MQVLTIFANNRLRNNQYIINADVNICIDPYDGDQICEYFTDNQLQASVLLNTHQHYDHIKGNDAVTKLGAKLIDNKTLIRNELKIDEQFKLSALFTPGHTLDSYSYIIKCLKTGRSESIILGDTLFHLGVGNCYNGGDPKVLANTILELDNILDENTRLFLGHDYFESNLSFTRSQFELPSFYEDNKDKQDRYLYWGAQKKVNPFLRVLFDDSFRKKYYEQQDAVEAFINMRELRDKH